MSHTEAKRCFDRSRGQKNQMMNSVLSSDTMRQASPKALQTIPNVGRILVVDDDKGIVDVVRMALEAEGHRTVTAADGSTALDLARMNGIDLMILDIGLPDIDGWEVCKQVRSSSDIRILMLTARDEDRDIVRGLVIGADDYLVKPFKVDELLARTRALLRRRVNTSQANVLTLSDLRMDLGTHEVHRGSNQIPLTATEFMLLEIFLRNARRVLAKEALLTSVWGESEDADVNFVEVYVGRLRRKLGEPFLIQTVRGVGYVLKSE